MVPRARMVATVASSPTVTHRIGSVSYSCVACVRVSAIYRGMHLADDNAITDVGAAIVSELLTEIGGPLPVQAMELPPLIGLALWPHDGTCDNCHAAAGECERHSCCPDCTHGPDGLCDSVSDAFAQWHGRIRYLCLAPQLQQERVVAMACARHLVRRHGGDVHCASLIEYVATVLCGLPRQPLAVRPLCAPASRAHNE